MRLDRIKKVAALGGHNTNRNITAIGFKKNWLCLVITVKIDMALKYHQLCLTYVAIIIENTCSYI